jgi:hypothetical protein
MRKLKVLRYSGVKLIPKGGLPGGKDNDNEGDKIIR